MHNVENFGSAGEGIYTVSSQAGLMEYLTHDL